MTSNVAAIEGGGGGGGGGSLKLMWLLFVNLYKIGNETDTGEQSLVF